MALINLNLSDAEQKLVQALHDQIIPELTNEVVTQVVPALRDALDGMHVEVKFTVDITRKA